MKDHDRDENILLLTNAAKALISCAEEIRKEIETIMHSCDAPGTKGNSHKGMLRTKVENLKNSASLQISASKKLFIAADKLANGAPGDEIIANVLVYIKFLSDQLKCEEYDTQRILKILCDDSQDNPESLKT